LEDATTFHCSSNIKLALKCTDYVCGARPATVYFARILVVRGQFLVLPDFISKATHPIPLVHGFPKKSAERISTPKTPHRSSPSPSLDRSSLPINLPPTEHAGVTYFLDYLDDLSGSPLEAVVG
jgi:hypothetical protein